MSDSPDAIRPCIRQSLSGWSRRDGGRITFTLEHVEPSPDHPPQGIPFMVDERPNILWDHNPSEKNLHFLKGIDSGYFRQSAHVHFRRLKRSDSEEERKRAATALRIEYWLALETFSALVATAVQSPRFALGWMLRYKNKDLVSVIQKLSSGEPVHSAWPESFSWLRLSQAVHTAAGEAQQTEKIQSGFARAWKGFAAEFIDQSLVAEYNSLKHGLRARAGGFQISVGTPDTNSEGAPPPDAMTRPSGSEFGCSYYTSIKLGGHQQNWVLAEHHQNWVPENLIDGLVVLAMSINNVTWFLRQQGGDKTPPELQTLENPTQLLDAWLRRLEWDRLSTEPIVSEQHLLPWEKEDICALFPKK